MSTEPDAQKLKLDRRTFQRIARWDRSVPHSGVSEAVAAGHLVVADGDLIHIDVQPRFGTPLGDLSVDRPPNDYVSGILAKFDPPENSIDRLVLLGVAADELLAALDRDFPSGPDGMSLGSSDSGDIMKAIASLDSLRAKCRGLFGWLYQIGGAGA